MRVIGVDSQGNPVQFEADAQLIEADVASNAHGAIVALGAASGKLTTLRLDSGGTTGKTGNATSGAATLNKASGQITSESLTTAAGADYTLTLTNSLVAATDLGFASVQNGSNTTGDPSVLSVTPGAGSLVVKVRNEHASAAFNGTLKISYLIVKV